MRGMDGLCENSLPWMEGVGAFGRRRLVFRGAENWFWLGGANLKQREIFDLPGPGELGVCERGIRFRPGNLWKRHGQQSDVPKRSGKNCSARQLAIDPDIPEKTCGKKILCDARAAEQFREIAGKALVKLPPTEIE